MKRKALCVGINDYPFEGSDLNGCVNDAKGWAELLREHYGFAPADVRLLLDTEATKANIVAGLRDLLAGAAAGDVLVFTNSSHGTYLADTQGDEERYDEAICPYDCVTNVLVDDELRELFAQLPPGVHLTVISDSCFSGTVTRAVAGEVLPGLRPPDDRRVRFLNPTLRGGKALKNVWKAKPRKRTKYPQSKMKEVLLSGCSSKEYSYDALIEGAYHGTMTYYALQAIRQAGYTITYTELEERLLALLEGAGYPQHPRLEGRLANRKRLLFS